MQVKPHSHLTYCTNIHGGVEWNDAFAELKKALPLVKKELNVEKLGVGLRLSNTSSLALSEESTINEFQNWLDSEGLYVFTINGFPYGDFHGAPVKDQVHFPDWTTSDRLEYTKRLFKILSVLLPSGMTGGVSTSPLSYRNWPKPQEEVKKQATTQLLELVDFLGELEIQTGKTLHLDIEPEPDGLLQTSDEFVRFYNDFLISSSPEEKQALIRKHIRLCLDVCHMSVMFEDVEEVIKKMQKEEILIGRLQISAAPHLDGPSSLEQDNLLKSYEEPIYLHQTVVLDKKGSLRQFPDLGDYFCSNNGNRDWKSLRVHYHVPIFLENLGSISSTQQDILKLLEIWKRAAFTYHLEVETYTWGVLPKLLQLPIEQSIVRELNWVRTCII